MDYSEVSDIIKEFLKYNGYKSTLESLESEEKAKIVGSKLPKKSNGPQTKVVFKIFTFFQRKEKLFQKSINSLKKRKKFQVEMGMHQNQKKLIKK